MNSYSLLMLDASGTLLDSGGQISPNTQKLLNRLERRGVPVALCSSGPPSGADTVGRQCGLKGPLVCYDGSLILDEKRNILEDTGIDAATALNFKRYVADEFFDVAVTSYLYEIWLVDSVQNPNVRMAIARYGYEAVEGPLETAVPPVGHAHKIMCVGQASQLKSLRKRAAALFPTLSLAAVSANYLEITASGVSKRTAMTKMQQYYDVAPEQVVAIGDYFTDADMLRHAGLGIAMGNAPESVKRAAARVTASNDEEGVYIALKNLRFRPPG